MKTNLIGISGRIGSGKDTVGTIIQYLVCNEKDTLAPHQKFENLYQQIKDFKPVPISNQIQSGWEIKKFAEKLKQIVVLLTGCNREDLEDQEFKKQSLPECWDLEEFNGVTFENIPLTYREMLQKVGTEAMREVIHENVWVNALFADYKPTHSMNFHMMDMGKGSISEPLGEPVKGGYPNWIITDMRFPNELKAVENRDGITIRVNRPGIKLMDHPSETSLDNATFKYVINNDGTIDELIEKVREILKAENII